MLRLIESEPASVEVTPLQLLGVILKSVLDERITDEEVERICTVYRYALIEWFS